MSASHRSVRQRDGALDRVRVAVEERPLAFRRLRNDGPAVPCVARDDVEVEVEDRLKGGLPVTQKTLIPSQRRPRRSARAMS